MSDLDAPTREIERKFLLRRMPDLAGLDVTVKDIVQGYLPGETLVERLRRIRTGDRTRWIRTVKLGRGLSRIEVEEDTDERVFRRMWPLTRGRRVRKRRYEVREGGWTWAVDRFRDRPLVLCEVELPSEDADPPLPDWLRAVLVRDVTGEDAYVNLNLAQ